MKETAVVMTAIVLGVTSQQGVKKKTYLKNKIHLSCVWESAQKLNLQEKSYKILRSDRALITHVCVTYVSVK